ncbi:MULTISPECIES: PCC domain-containing protein [Chryseobacterium]|uniref:PCC domain-containing protein n=1 Tax=Chryseobacterium TaxID=59732 RepID=UPI00155669AB|nr:MULTISPECIES: PPC domain-containing DNA-binding protein [unclassified Chryseobacterium]MDC8103916.1 DNA-binding protein [Chryseobacterium sp. B21-037]MDQ1803521.1 DNA-binding protein [Chryseobacterium sp. CKR4-1]WBV57445.1 DNA-binding protein [Chryseobacterium daecheongense]
MNSQIVTGNLWTAHRIEDYYIVKLQDKADVLDALNDFVSYERIKSGNFSGVGIVKEMTLRFLEPIVKKYLYTHLNNPIEIQNISGAVSDHEGKISVSLNATLEWRNETTLSGQLIDAKVHGCTEFLFYSADDRIITDEFLDLCHTSFWSFN